MNRVSARCRIARFAATLVFGAIALALSAQEHDAEAGRQDESYIAHRIDAQIVVADPDASSVRIATFADEHGGYFTLRSRDVVQLRIPNRRLDLLRTFVRDIADETVRYDPSSTDWRLQLVRVEAGITSREEALEQILAFLEDADIDATLAFEQELRALNGELESLKGQRRRILNDISFAVVSVALTSTESDVPAQIPSSFGWINRVDLYRFLREEGL